MKGYLRIELEPRDRQVRANWYYDDDDPDETTIVLDIKKIYLITDADGNVIPDSTTKDRQVSTAYEDIGVDPPAHIQATRARRPGGQTKPEGRSSGERARFQRRAVPDPLRHRL